MSGYPIDRRIKHATLDAFKADKIPVDSTYFDNTGSLVAPKTIITQQGNSFNGAGQLVQLDSNSKLPTVDGSNLTNVISSGAAPSIPYSVISAKTSSGIAAFITKTSNTQIDFDTNSGGIPIKICYPDGSIESNNSLTGISGISADNTYYVIKEKASNPYNTTLLPIESCVEPSTPATNQLWLDISVVPAIPKKYNGSAWVVTQFVKLGEFTRTSGIVGTPVSYALNAMAITITNAIGGSSTTTINHNLGTIQHSTVVDLVCKIAEQGYVIGDRIENIIGYDGAGISIIGVRKTRNTAIVGTFGTAPVIKRADNGGYSYITPANWNIEFISKRRF